MKIRFTGNLPKKAHDGDAGFDLTAVHDGWVKPGEISRFDTGTTVEIPKGYVGLVFGRSGLGFKYGVSPSNAVGVIDPGYTGNILVALTSHIPKSTFIAAGDRIAQLVIIKTAVVDFEEAETLDESERGGEGFGSSGK